MKNLKKLFFGLIMIIFGFVVFGFNNQTNFSQVQTSAATLKNNPLDYITVISDGQLLTKNNVTVINDTSISAMLNGPVTINVNPLTSKILSFSEFNDLYFTKNYINYSIPLSENPEEMSFEYNGLTYYCRLRQTSSANPVPFWEIFNSSKVASTLDSSTIFYTETETHLNLQILESYSLKSNLDSKSVDFKFTITTSQVINNKTMTYQSELTLKLIRPSVKFANSQENLVMFDTYKDYNPENLECSYDYNETTPWLQREQTFNKIKLNFLNNIYEYSETNPLYFNINFNGFTYKYKFYAGYAKIVTKVTNGGTTSTIEEEYGDKCLFVEYSDEISQQTVHLATNYTQELDSTNTPFIKYIEKVLFDEQFSIEFTYRGRYAIEFYDNTYLENFKTPNYYSTSFYIKNDTINENDTISRFNDIYILAESIDNNNQPLEYIVNKSTQNNSVRVTIKNMYFDSNDSIALSDVIEKINITITEFGNTGGNEPITKSYYPVTNQNKFDTSILKINDVLRLNNGDYYMYCQNDAIYSFEIFSKDKVLDNFGVAQTQKTKYQFTIVKDIKVSFKPDVDDGTDSTYTAKTPYRTETKNYTNKIQNSDPIQINVYYNGRTPNFILDFSKEYSFIQLEDEEDYNNLPFFTGAVIDGNEINDFEFFKNYKENLTYFKIANNDVIDLSFIAEFKNLEILEIENINATDLSFIANLTNLKTLYIRNTKIDNISFVTSLSNLQNLILIFNEELTNYMPISSLRNMQYLKIEYHSSMINIANKTTLKNNNPNATIEISSNEESTYDKTWTNDYNNPSFVLDITYLNRYSISYGMQAVNIVHGFNEDKTEITFQFYGVGDMRVTIKKGNEELVYTFNSERGRNYITFAEFAEYTIDLVDSMGTSPPQLYYVNFQKELNTSAIVLIVLASVLVAGIAAFIIIVRGRIKTR